SGENPRRPPPSPDPISISRTRPLSQSTTWRPSLAPSRESATTQRRPTSPAATTAPATHPSPPPLTRAVAPCAPHLPRQRRASRRHPRTLCMSRHGTAAASLGRDL
uniref:Uncharacterized protein n=1 Tax=Aegilops tauschii subsp. strangulata TaxID=200361 RepID=A0A453S550_AEGTS